MHKFRTFGSIAYAHVDKAGRGKIDKRARKCIFVGFEPESNCSRLIDTLIRSRNVIFNESTAAEDNEDGSQIEVDGEFSDEEFHVE